MACIGNSVTSTHLTPTSATEKAESDWYRSPHINTTILAVNATIILSGTLLYQHKTMNALSLKQLALVSWTYRSHKALNGAASNLSVLLIHFTQHSFLSSETSKRDLYWQQFCFLFHIYKKCIEKLLLLSVPAEHEMSEFPCGCGVYYSLAMTANGPCS